MLFMGSIFLFRKEKRRIIFNRLIRSYLQNFGEEKLPPKFFSWWSQAGSNRRPPACKAGALPAELWPLDSQRELVGLGGFEPPTSPLSGVRSNQLSYRPKSCDLLLSFRLRPRIIRRELQFTKEYVNKRH